MSLNGSEMIKRGKNDSRPWKVIIFIIQRPFKHLFGLLGSLRYLKISGWVKMRVEWGRNDGFYGGNHPTFFPPLSSFRHRSEVILKVPFFPEWLRTTFEWGMWSEWQEWKREWLWIQGCLTLLPHRLAFLFQRVWVVLASFQSFRGMTTFCRSVSFWNEMTLQREIFSFLCRSITKALSGCDFQNEMRMTEKWY